MFALAPNADRSFRRPIALPTVVVLTIVGLISGGAALGQGWTHFEMNRTDGAGDYLWTYPENWHNGVPNRNLSAEIGDDSSGRAMHSVLKSPGAEVYYFEFAEHGRTEGSTFRILQGADLTIYGNAVISKDREGWVYIDGTVRATVANRGFRVGGPWGQPDSGLPSRGHVIIGPTGVLETWAIGINTTYNTTAPSSPWGPDYYSRATGSEIVVDGGLLIARQGLRMSTIDANKPGAIRLRGDATFTTNFNATYGIDVWCGVWEIDGGDADINVGDIEFWGNKFENAINVKNNKPVGSGLSVLKLTGDGISTINARSVNFIDAAILDVGDLNVPYGTYTVIDAASFSGTNLRFADGTDARRWTFEFDTTNGDLLLTRGFTGLMGDVDESGYVEDHDLSLLLAYWDYGVGWTQGDLDENGTVDDDDLSLLLANWHAGVAPGAGAAVPEPATLSLLGLGVLLRKRR